MVYEFKCTHCGIRAEGLTRDFAEKMNKGRPHRFVRVYSFSVGTGARVSRDGTVRDQARLFLPDNNEFKGPDDPDGTKGARAWLDSHAPKEKGGRNPLLEIDRRTF